MLKHLLTSSFAALLAGSSLAQTMIEPKVFIWGNPPSAESGYAYSPNHPWIKRVVQLSLHDGGYSEDDQSQTHLDFYNSGRNAGICAAASVKVHSIASGQIAFILQVFGRDAIEEAYEFDW